MKKTLMASALATAMISGVANAEVRINGFANLTAGFLTSDVFNPRNGSTEVFNYDDKVDFRTGSLFAVQIMGDINDKMTATAQIVARGLDDYSAEFEWAYITYNVSDNLAVNAGRLRLPLFRYSASSDVGYSFHWAQVPFAVYDVPFSNLDGVRIDYTGYAGDWDYLLQFGAGTYNAEIGGGNVTGDDLLLFTAEASNGGFKARTVAGRSLGNFSAAASDAAFDQLAQISPDLAEKMRFRDEIGTFLGLGLEYDNFDWFVSGEITETSGGESFSADDLAYYVTAGIRSGKFTPSLTYSARDGKEDIKFLDGVAQLPPEFQPAAAAIVIGFQEFFFEDYAVTTVGLRYDLDAQVALKFDLSRYDDKISNSLDSNMIRVAVNYVF